MCMGFVSTCESVDLEVVSAFSATVKHAAANIRAPVFAWVCVFAPLAFPLGLEWRAPLKGNCAFILL